MSKKELAASAASFVLIALALVGVTLLVFVQGGTNGIAVHLYYLPIIFAAFFFGDYGAILAALIAAAICVWMPESRTWDPSVPGWVIQPQDLLEVLVRGMMFFVVGLVSSWTATQLRRRISEARTLYEVARNITSTLRIQRVLQLIADYAVQVMDARACSIRLLNADTGELDLVAQHGLTEDYWHKGPVSLVSSELDREVLGGAPVQIRDVCADPRFQYREAARSEGLSSVLCVPLETTQRIHGVARIYAHRRRRFRRSEIDLLTAFANQAAVALENAALYEELEDSYFDTVRALTRAIEAKDMATYSHSERVADLAEALARELGMNEERRELLRFGAILHDVGKIGISDSSMEARDDGNVDHIFYAMHPLIGQAILAPVHFLKPILSVVISHHESWDGSGFPEGLSGRAIPLEARIVAICDAYDRLMHPVNGHALRRIPQEALDGIVAGAGTQFDPDIVVAFRRSRMRGPSTTPSTPPPSPAGGE